MDRWRSEHAAAADFLGQSCERALAATCAHLTPPFCVDDFLSAAPVVEILGEAQPQGGGGASDAGIRVIGPPDAVGARGLFGVHNLKGSDKLDAESLARIVLESQNGALLALVLRLGGDGGGDGRAAKKKHEALEQLSIELQKQVTELKRALETEKDARSAERARAEAAARDAAAKAAEDTRHEAEAEIDDLREANAQLGETLSVALGSRDLTDVAAGALDKLHSETGRLHFRLSKQKKDVIPQLDWLREENAALADKCAKVTNALRRAEQLSIELGHQLAERETRLEKAEERVSMLEHERGSLVNFLVEALGRDELSRALSQPNVRSSMVTASGQWR